MAHRDDLDALIDALAVTCSLTGTDLTAPAVKVMAQDLMQYPLAQVLAALTRCRRELKGRLTYASIIERMDDGRPTPNEAWAMIPVDEAGSVVWTDEMAEAYGAAAPLIAEGERIAARMAFIEAYERIVAKARAENRAPRWSPSLGHDPMQRARALEDAERRGRLAPTDVAALLPGPDRDQARSHMHQLLTGPADGAKPPPAVREQLARFIASNRAKEEAARRGWRVIDDNKEAQG